MRHNGFTLRDGQGGAALLVFMLVLIIGSSYMIVSRLNEYAQSYARDSQTKVALLEAKKALLNYAMNYPELNNKPERGPGYLPCPDENDDGAVETNCSITTGSTLGRLPTETLGLGDLRDSSGERLWYAVSQNFKYNQSSDYVLNSDTEGTISVDGTGDVVAIIIAPGAPVADQSGRHDATETAAIASNDLYQVADEYLEDDNATTGDASYVSTASGEFNDQVVTITRSELMQYVEKRVLEQVRDSLASYKAVTGAYPWLTSFSDPKADARWLRGDATSTSASSLVDSSADFSTWGVSVGDVVWNVTDGTVAEVSSTPTSTSVPTSGIGFDSGDEYLIELSALTTALSGTATAGSSGTTLEDTGKDFEALLVVPGDIVDDMTDGSTGRVDTVSGDTISVSDLSHGTNNTFTTGDTYRIRSNAGTATSGSSGTVLEDTTVNFQSSGTRPLSVQAGDLVSDITDGSFGIVSAVTGTHKLTVSELNKLDSPSAGAFDSGDLYTISRFQGATGTNEGLLSLQEPGQALPTGFTLDWALSSSSGVDVTSGLDSTYGSSITSLVQSSASHSSTVSVSSSGGSCIWVAESIADCRGIISDPDFLSGTVTGQSGSYMTDSTQDFSVNGIKRGDKVQNTSDSTIGIVRSVSSSTTVRISNIYGYSGLNYAAGQAYRVYTASHSITGTASWPTSVGVYKMYDSGADFSTVKVGDTIENTSWNAIGMVTGVHASASTPYLDFTALQNGTYTDFYPGEGYTIHTQYVDKRVYQFQVRMKMDDPSTANLEAAVAASGGLRTRSVCVGYDAGSGCGTVSATPSTLPDNGIAPQISLLDYDSSDPSPVASATAPKNGSGATGSLRISGMAYPLAADDSTNGLPSWFINNRWHQLVYVAYSSPFGPGGAGSCTAGTDCLTLSVQFPAASYNDRQALVMSAGMQLDSQDRTLGQLGGYFESENAVAGDDIFEKGAITTSFNDQVSGIAP